MQFGELHRELPGISKKVLTQALRAMERDGLVGRHAPERKGAAVVYSLTPVGDRLREPLLALSAWAQQHASVIEDARARFDATHPAATRRRS
jgi:DNA-binding HxlR family transcriptional regulator